MTDLRQAAQQALHELDSLLHALLLGIPFYRKYGVRVSNAITALRTALEQQQAEPVFENLDYVAVVYSPSNAMLKSPLPIGTHLYKYPPQQQAEPVSHAVIVGALFDFMGWLTTRKERLVLSSTDNASPAADATKAFAEMRGLPLDDARVQDWQNYTTQPQRPWVGLTDEDFLEACQLAERGNYLVAFQRIQTKLKEKNDY